MTCVYALAAAHSYLRGWCAAAGQLGIIAGFHHRGNGPNGRSGRSAYGQIGTSLSSPGRTSVSTVRISSNFN